MKLFLKREKTVDNCLFVIFDELCGEKYRVQRSKKTLVLISREEEPLMKIRELGLAGLNAYSIRTRLRNVRLIINLTQNASSCRFLDVNWHFRGDLLSKSFDILGADNSLVMSHQKRFSTLGEGIELNITSENDELLCLGAAVCLNLRARSENFLMQTV